MLYPRKTETGELVTDEQLVGSREHLIKEHRVFFLSGPIGGDTEAHNTLLACDSISHEPIKIVITSPGGDLDSTFLLYDTIKLLQSPVWTFGRFCASAAVLILAAGQQRYLSTHARVMLHLISGQTGGDARDLDIQHRQMKKYEEQMVNILIECGVKKDRDTILRDIDRDLWLEPEESVDYGLADGIMTKEILKEWMR